MAKSRFITQILRSIFFKKAGLGAVRYARNSSSLLDLIRRVLDKSGGLSGASFTQFRTQLLVVSRLLKAYASGEYRQVPWKTIVRIIAVLLYFVNPIDIIPDLLPIIGLTDDIALTLWLFSAAKDDINAFLAWEQSRNAARAGSSVPIKTIPIG
ncbi:MAG: DUF1232 domain-containing protein [Spirosoma sp.]|nr:DUF1232 domain-containing protein [Spirosoma sp.]